MNVLPLWCVCVSFIRRPLTGQLIRVAISKRDRELASLYAPPPSDGGHTRRVTFALPSITTTDGVLRVTVFDPWSSQPIAERYVVALAPSPPYCLSETVPCVTVCADWCTGTQLLTLPSTLPRTALRTLPVAASA